MSSAAVLDPARAVQGDGEKLDFAQVRDILVHRFPLLMIDRVQCLERGKRIVAVKNVTGNEIHFLGHFPARAIMPGVLIIEAMAQATVILDTLSRENVEEERKITKFLTSAEIRFLKPVLPGDQLQLEAEIVKQIEYGVVARVLARVETVVARGELVLGKRSES